MQLGMRQHLPYGIPILFISPCCVCMDMGHCHISFILPKARLPAWCVCSQWGFVGVTALSPAGATKFFHGFTLSVFVPNSSARRWDMRFKGAVLMHLSHTVLKHGFALRIQHWAPLSGWLPLSYGRGMSRAHHKELQYFMGPGKATHKKCTQFLPNGDSQAGMLSL